jgi:uncharacterized membrane protein
LPFSIRVNDEINEKQDNLVADRDFVPEISLKDMFDDAFNPISRDGAGTIEVALWFQKAFRTLASFNNKVCTEKLLLMQILLVVMRRRL